MDHSASRFCQEISSLLASRTPRKLVLEHHGRAAVLIPIFQRNKERFFLLTRRTQKVETHKGEISFPGGMTETESEPLSQTALRETWEEIGLAPSQVRVLGQFDEYPSINGLIVTPFVGWIEPPVGLSPSPDEVEEVLEVPFSLFQDKTNRRVEIRKRLGQDSPVYFYRYQGREIWGLTARIIRDFLILIGTIEDN